MGTRSEFSSESTCDFFPHSLNRLFRGNYPHVYKKLWITPKHDIGRSHRRKKRRRKKSTGQTFFDFFDIGDQFGLRRGEIGGNLIAGVDHRGMIFAAENLPNFRERHIDNIPTKIHRNLPGDDDIFTSSVRKNVAYGDVEITGNDF